MEVVLCIRAAGALCTYARTPTRKRTDPHEKRRGPVFAAGKHVLAYKRPVDVPTRSDLGWSIAVANFC